MMQERIIQFGPVKIEFESILDILQALFTN
jgi:hypothetical protein